MQCRILSLLIYTKKSYKKKILCHQVYISSPLLAMMLENHHCSIASAAEPLNILYTVYPQQNQVAVPPPYMIGWSKSFPGDYSLERSERAHFSFSSSRFICCWRHSRLQKAISPLQHI